MTLLVGSQAISLGRASTVRLPKAWAAHGEQHWLLFPQHLVRSCCAAPGWLILLPHASSTYRALERIQANAFEFGFPETVATLVRTIPTQRAFRLTQPQLDWLEVPGGQVFLSGLLVRAMLCSPRRWEEMRSSGAARRPDRDLF